MSSNRRDYEIEQTIFLGGQASGKHEDFKILSRLTPDIGFLYLFLSKKEKIKALPHKDRILAELELIGESEFVKATTELTKLSMILGDTRGRYSMKDVKDAPAPTT